MKKITMLGALGILFSPMGAQTTSAGAAGTPYAIQVPGVTAYYEKSLWPQGDIKEYTYRLLFPRTVPVMQAGYHVFVTPSASTATWLSKGQVPVTRVGFQVSTVRMVRQGTQVVIKSQEQAMQVGTTVQPRSIPLCNLYEGGLHGRVGFTLSISAEAPCRVVERAALPVLDALVSEVAH